MFLKRVLKKWKIFDCMWLKIKLCLNNKKYRFENIWYLLNNTTQTEKLWIFFYWEIFFIYCVTNSNTYFRKTFKYKTCISY